MKILAMIGSPRKGGNTEILVDEMLRGAQVGGHIQEKICLYHYEILPCMDCRKCKKGDCICPLDDGMQEIYPKIDAADLIVFGTPNYWFGPTGKMKLLLDRMRPYVASGRLKGKKAILVTPAGDGPPVCGPLVEMFRLSFDYLGMEFIGKILGTAYEKGEIAQDEVALKDAYELGASL